LALADQRLRYLGRRWYDLVVILLPLLRPLQLLRLIPLLSVLSRRAQTGLRGRVAVYVAGGASLLAFVAAIAVLDVERSSPDANINGFGDAIWWAVTTMTTVGYGDHYPVTGIGRAVGFGLMLGDCAFGHGHRNLGVLVSRECCGREGAGRGFTGRGPAT
jgi:voltage-gated potassium channel